MSRIFQKQKDENFQNCKLLNDVKWFTINGYIFTMVEETFNISPSRRLKMGLLLMIIVSPWLKKILIFHLHRGLKWAYFE